MDNSACARGCGVAAFMWRCLAVVAMTVVPHQTAYPQNISRTVEFEELGFTHPLNVGSRPAGMAGAYVAAGNDVHTLIYNPAGLARIRRIELSLGLQQEHTRVDNTFHGTPTSASTRYGGFDGAALAWPVPTFMGSLVPAFGVYRIFSSAVDVHHSGVDPSTQAVFNHLHQQTGSTYSYNLGFGVDLSPALSGGLSLFVLNGSLDVLGQSDSTFYDAGRLTSVFIREDVTASITGIGGRIGIQFFFHPLVSGGVTFTPPVWANVKGDSTAEITRHVENAPDDESWVSVSIDDDYLLPFRIDLGVAFFPGRYVFEIDVRYTDWTEASLNGKRFRNPSSLETTFRQVYDFKFGAEYTFARFPVRARAGYAYLPYPLEYLQVDRIDKNNLTKAGIDNQRQLFALGLGALIGGSLNLDASFSVTKGKRATEILADEQTHYRFVLWAAYRF